MAGNKKKSIDLESVRLCWERERPLYEELAKHVRLVLESRVLNAGIQADVKCRVKETSSLLKKLLRKNTTYEAITDKAGVRIVPLFLSEVEPIRQIVRQTFGVIEEEDKIDELLYNRLGYQAIHFVVRDQSFADMVCEIQLRTLHQDLWAEASHRLQYKSEEHVPDDIKRRIYRLSAVLEVADVEFDTIKKAIDRLPGTEPLAVLNHLEHHYFRMIPGHHDRRLSLEVVTTLMPLLRELSADPKAFVDEFVARNDSDLRRIYHTYSEAKDELRRIFLFQPESTLIFACLEFDRHRTFALWEERFPRDLLADMAAIWGIRAPYDYTEE